MSDNTIERPTVDAAPARPVRDESREEKARSTAYRSRFAAIYLALAVVAGAAIGGFVVVLAAPEEESPSNQARQAIGTAMTGEAGAIDIADQVQRLYRRIDGTELVTVVATRNTIQDGGGGFLRVRFQVIQPGDATKERDSQLVAPDDAIHYSLCGIGDSCTIPGAASVARGTLLRREALELALRTLQRDQNVDNVAVFLRPIPPPDGSSFEGYAFVFNRASIQRNDAKLLAQPINQTLPGAGIRMTPANVTQDEYDRVNELTRPYLYLYRYQLLAGRDALLQLQPARS